MNKITFLLIISSIWGGMTKADAVQPQIPTHCQKSYELGIKDFYQLFKKENSESIDLEKNCEMSYLKGSLTSYEIEIKKLIFEYLLEFEFHQKNQTSHWQLIQKHFHQRFMQYPDGMIIINGIEKNFSQYLAILPELHNKMANIAFEQRSAQSIGRFIYTSGSHQGPMTIYEYQINTEQNQISPSVSGGSYHRLIEKIYIQAQDIATQYLSYRPNSIFGEDSFLYGALTLAAGELTVREVKENGYFDQFDTVIHMAERHNLKTMPLLKIKELMLTKQKSSIDQHIKVLNQLTKAVIAAPFIPASIALGSSGLVYSGVKGAQGIFTFKLIAGSWASAQNISALSALAPMLIYAGVGTVAAIKEKQLSDQANLPFHLNSGFDKVLGMVADSFPTAALLPSTIGGVAAGGKYMLLSMRSFLTFATQTHHTLQTKTWMELAKATAGLPKSVLQMWAKGWMNKMIWIHFAADTTVFLTFEVGVRQLMGGKSKFISYDENGEMQFNRDGLISVGKYFITSVITKPIILVPNFWVRFGIYRIVDTISTLTSALIVNGEVDLARVKFDAIVGTLIGTANGEFQRSVKLSDTVTSLSGGKQYALVSLFKFASKSLVDPVYIYLLDDYREKQMNLAPFLRLKFKELCHVDIDDYSDEEIYEALEDFKNESL